MNLVIQPFLKEQESTKRTPNHNIKQVTLNASIYNFICIQRWAIYLYWLYIYILL